MQVRHVRQRIQRVAHQRLFIFADLCQPQCRDVIQRRAQADNAACIRRTGFKSPRRFCPGGAFTEANSRDHRTAPLPRRHRLQDLGLDVQRANPRRAVELMARKSVEVAVQRLDVNRVMHHRLGTIDQDLRAMTVCQRNQLRQRVLGAQNIGYLRDRQQARAGIKQLYRSRHL